MKKKNLTTNADDKLGNALGGGSGGKRVTTRNIEIVCVSVGELWGGVGESPSNCLTKRGRRKKWNGSKVKVRTKRNRIRDDMPEKKSDRVYCLWGGKRGKKAGPGKKKEQWDAGNQ